MCNLHRRSIAFVVALFTEAVIFVVLATLYFCASPRKCPPGYIDTPSGREICLKAYGGDSVCYKPQNPPQLKYPNCVTPVEEYLDVWLYLSAIALLALCGTAIAWCGTCCCCPISNNRRYDSIQ